MLSNMIKKFNKNGFTLLEVIVAIFVITIGVIGVISVVQRTAAFTSISSSRLQAAYLAQEGIEIARNIRDGNWLEAGGASSFSQKSFVKNNSNSNPLNQIRTSASLIDDPSIILRPNAAGDVTQLGNNSANANWQNVDEATSDGNDTYVYGQYTFYVRDLYNLFDHTTESETINSVTIYILARKDVQVAGGGKTLIKTGGTEYLGAENTLTDSYASYSTTYTTNPQAGGAWTWAQIDALQAGVALRTGINYWSYCTQVYVEVNYTGVPPPPPPPPPPSVPWDDGLPPGDWEVTYQSQSLESYQGRYLNIDSNGFYSYLTGETTKFKRKITIQKPSPDILNVQVEVTWSDRGAPYSLTAKENLYKWR